MPGAKLLSKALLTTVLLEAADVLHARPQPVSHDAHDLQCEEWRSMDVGHELVLVYWYNATISLGDSIRASGESSTSAISPNTWPASSS